MLIKNIRDFKNIPLISVDKDVYLLLLDNGFNVINVENSKYFFIKTDNLCEFLKREGVNYD